MITEKSFLMPKYIEKLPWDSAFFSLPIGRITASALDDKVAEVALKEARAEGISCLYFEADPNDLTSVLTIEKNDFHLVDVRIVLEYPFEDRPAPSLRYPIPSELLVMKGDESDLHRLEEIAVEISRFSRYSFDNKFRLGDHERLYRQWIINSFHGLADIVFVARWAEESSDVVGLISCVARDAVAHIQLAGVHHIYRQKGVGTGLVQTALDWARGEKVRKMQVVTQARNVSAQRLYQQMGFFTKSMSLYYHKWL
jgi:GNAT superfamily N-acetyltransferase